MKMAINKSVRGVGMKPITVSNANATWENASSKINYYESYNTEDSESIQIKTVREQYQFVTEWTVHNDKVVVPSYEYKNKDEFIVDW